MLYIISGTSRSGKTIIAKKMMQICDIPFVSLDWLIMGFTNGIPEYGIHDKLWPDEIAEKFWNFLKALCENMIWTETDYILEGEAVLPELINELLIKYPDSIKICFVGYPSADFKEKVKDVYEYSYGEKDWLTKEPKDYVESHISNMITYSKRIEKDCKTYDIPYFDTSKNFMKVLDTAVAYLLRK
ncbi:MAG: hypothetical protein HKP00_12715 [Flavobacteriaceae bacterium]|nr:hypothetical protein [Flavobacteriaceae bacterium]